MVPNASQLSSRRIIFFDAQIFFIFSKSSQKPKRLVIRNAFRGYFSMIFNNFWLETFKVSSSMSMGIGFKPSWIRGITLVAHVKAEKPTKSFFCNTPKFRRDWVKAKLAELPLLKNTQYFLP